MSDPTGVLATPLEPVLAPAGKKGMGQLLALVREIGAERVVVGLPLLLVIALIMALWWGRRGRSPFAGSAWRPGRLPIDVEEVHSRTANP